jgi:tRNA(adenine34) deaminase
MVQARIARLVFAVDDSKAGAAGSVMDLLQHPGLNHKVRVERGLLMDDVQQLLADFFKGLRDGTVRRYSEGWKQSQLAGNRESA